MMGAEGSTGCKALDIGGAGAEAFDEAGGPAALDEAGGPASLFFGGGVLDRVNWGE